MDELKLEIKNISKGFGEIRLKGLEPKNKNSEKNSMIKF